MANIIQQHTLEKAKMHWEVKGTPKLLRTLQNTVYQISIADEPAVLRLTNSNHRNILQLKQELEWTLFLANNGCNAARPLASTKGNLVETIAADDSEYFSSVFSFAVGKPIEETGVLCPATLIAWGKEMGKMHRLSAHYHPQYQRDSYDLIKKYKLDFASHSEATNATSSIITRIDKWINGLPKDKTNYGMIHGDSVNFHIHENKVTFFDFDDCTYHWFCFDIANGLYSLRFIIQNENIDCGLTFTDCINLFIQGYRKEKEIDQIWVDRIPCFIKYRTALLYQWLKTPETAPRWVLDIEAEWRNKLELWINENLTSELNLI